MTKTCSTLIVVWMLVLPGSAGALETNELIAIAAMPLAVAAVADITDVPRDDLVTMVTTLNRAAVPPPQFIEVVRYAPVALVDTREPRFVTYVTTQYDRGLIGEALALSIADRYETYGIREIRVADPPAITVVERSFIPAVVVTRLQPVEFDPLALIAMPLAVAAVADMTDVPTRDLMSFVASLNRALVPAPQFIEIVRYSPVVLVDPALEPQFITFVTTEVDRGVAGSVLAIAIADRFRTAGVDEIDIIRPPATMIVDREVVIPRVVVSRVAEVRRHPHGGPPGQLKKEIGVQTGAEIVHGVPSSRGRSRDVTGSGRDRPDHDAVVTDRTAKRTKPAVRRDGRDRDRDRDQPRAKPPAAKQDKGHGSEHRRPAVRRDGEGSSGEGSGKPDKEKGPGKADKGKGKGKG